MRFPILFLLFSTLGLGHPGHDLNEEIIERRAFKNTVRHTSLAHCAEKLEARGVLARGVQRRAESAKKFSSFDVHKRSNVSQALSESHNNTGCGITENTSVFALFSQNASCLLTPEVTQGPYYVGGEYIRKDVTENQAGIDILLDYQVIDVDTCDPVPNVYVEIWHCNSTGVYSGVVSQGNGDSADATNLNTTFLRGIQKTDDDGVTQFASIFPGHYTGRATHIHVLVHTNATEQRNHTLGNTVYASHVGQAFFDQALIADVEKTAPYASNTQQLTQNADDDILAEEADQVDPIMAYTLLGNTVNDGLMAWLAFGINTSYTGEVTPAAFYYESGGVENADSQHGGGGPPNGTRPTGIPPSANSTLARSN